MKRTLFTLVALLALATLPGRVSAEEADSFLDVITEVSEDDGMYLPHRMLVYNPEKVAEIIARYDSPDAFMDELSAAWLSDDRDLQWYSLLFAGKHIARLPMRQADFDTLVRMVREKAANWPQAVEALAGSGREEFLPIFRSLVAEKGYVRLGVDALAHYAEKLTPEDVTLLKKTLLVPETYIDYGTYMQIDDGDAYVQRPVGYKTLDLLEKLGAADEATLLSLLEKEAVAGYDDAKFTHFLAEIAKPGVKLADFKRLADEAGLRPKTHKAEPELNFDSYHGQDSPIDEAWVRNYFTYSPRVAEKLLELKPDDRRGQFLLVQSLLRGQKKYGQTFYRLEVQFLKNLAQQKTLRPLNLFIARTPAVMTGTGYGGPGRMLLTVLTPIIEGELTADECRDCAELIIAQFHRYYFSQYHLNTLIDLLYKFQSDHRATWEPAITVDP